MTGGCTRVHTVQIIIFQSSKKVPLRRQDLSRFLAVTDTKHSFSFIAFVLWLASVRLCDLHHNIYGMLWPSKTSNLRKQLSSQHKHHRRLWLLCAKPCEQLGSEANSANRKCAVRTWIIWILISSLILVWFGPYEWVWLDLLFLKLTGCMSDRLGMFQWGGQTTNPQNPCKTQSWLWNVGAC